MKCLFKCGFAAATAALLSASAAHADLQVFFDEGAPKDRFRFENVGECTLTDASIRLDLSSSTAGLIFDVSGQGAGVEVFQPFEVTTGENSLKSVPSVVDGQSEVLLAVSSLAPGEQIAFTIDVDDTIGQREITVSASEIAGVEVSYVKGAMSSTGEFTDLAQTVVPITGC